MTAAAGRLPGMDRADVMAWVDGYERAWRDNDVDAVTRLFSDDAQYRASPYEPPEVGHAAIQAFWRDDEGRDFTMSATPVAVDGATAIVRVEVEYDDPAQEYLDLWVLRFAADGRVEDFEEWAYWPGKPYSATDA